MKADSMFCAECGFSFTGKAACNEYQENRNPKKLKKKWANLQLSLVFYLSILLGSLTFGLISRLYTSPILEVYFWIFFVSVTLTVTVKTWKKTKKTLISQHSKPKIFLELILVTFLALIFIKSYFFVIEYFNWPMSDGVSHYLENNWPLWSIFFISAIMPGVFEELAFRGILQTNLNKILSKKESLVIQAALFSVLHLAPVIFISHFVMGLLVGWIRLRLGHIYYGILLHILWNSSVIMAELEKL